MDRSASIIAMSHLLQTQKASHQETKEEAFSALLRIRDTIDNIDAALIYMLAERFRCTKEVGHLKAKYHLPPADPQREEEQISRLRYLASQARLDPDFAEKFLNFIIHEVIRHHEAIAKNTHPSNTYYREEEKYYKGAVSTPLKSP